MLAVLVSGGLAEARRPPSPEYQKVLDVFYSKELSKEAKIARLKEMTGAVDTRIFALAWLANLDAGEAVQTSLAIFRAKESSRELKLCMGHFLLEGTRPKSKEFPEGFVAEYAKYLINAVLDGGEAEFCQKLDGLSPTAVGEYAYLASSFDGYRSIDFAPFKDARLVPILSHCLDAPDNVVPKDQGDAVVLNAKPGDPTGRNVARQQIPVALVKLGDQRAVGPLKEILFKHADIYLRMNAAYALAGLMEKKEDRAAVGKVLLATPDLLWCRLPFGKGLIEAGDDAGMEFLALQHAGGYGSGPLEKPSAIFSVMNQRLIILKGFTSPRVEGFVREALGLKPLRAMLLFEPGSVKIEAYMYDKPPKDEAGALELAGPRIIRIYEGLLKCVETNKFKGLSADLEEIAKKTRSEKIRELTNDCLKSLAE